MNRNDYNLLSQYAKQFNFNPEVLNTYYNNPFTNLYNNLSVGNIDILKYLMTRNPLGYVDNSTAGFNG